MARSCAINISLLTERRCPITTPFNSTPKFKSALSGNQARRRAGINRHRARSATAAESRDRASSGRDRACGRRDSGNDCRDRTESCASGLDAEQRELIANEDDVKKLSTRDLPIAVARAGMERRQLLRRCGLHIAPAFGSSRPAASAASIAGRLPDVSADLPELARTPMIVVCSGAKIVLDLPATREWLETHSVTVVGYGCDEMPAFYSRSSGLPVDVRCDSPEEVVQIFKAQRDLGMKSALLVTVPVPAEAEVDADLLQRVLDDSLAEAERQQIAGRDLTPFLLARMSEKSEGATLRANIALLENNARVAAQIARAL